MNCEAPVARTSYENSSLRQSVSPTFSHSVSLSRSLWRWLASHSQSHVGWTQRVQLCSANRTDERTDERTNEGVPRGPRGPKNVLSRRSKVDFAQIKSDKGITAAHWRLHQLSDKIYEHLISWAAAESKKLMFPSLLDPIMDLWNLFQMYKSCKTFLYLIIVDHCC